MNSPLSNAHIGSLFVVVAPSGAGKSSLVNELLKSDDNILLSVSHHARAARRRSGRRGLPFHHGGRFLAETRCGRLHRIRRVHGNYYGTSKDWIVSALTGQRRLLEIDWRGAQQVRAFSRHDRHFHPTAVDGSIERAPAQTRYGHRRGDRPTTGGGQKMKWRTQVSVNMLSLTTYFPPLWRNCSRLLARHDCGLPRKGTLSRYF